MERHDRLHSRSSGRRHPDKVEPSIHGSITIRHVGGPCPHPRLHRLQPTEKPMSRHSSLQRNQQQLSGRIHVHAHIHNRSSVIHGKRLALDRRPRRGRRQPDPNNRLLRSWTVHRKHRRYLLASRYIRRTSRALPIPTLQHPKHLHGPNPDRNAILPAQPGGE